MKPTITFGNANIDGANYKGWFIGHFIDRLDDLRSTGAIEIKWGVHKAGENKSSWSKNIQATTLCVLITGRFRIKLQNREFLLSRDGDYVIWSPGIAHTWSAEEDTVILTIRWPSKPDDIVLVPNARGSTSRRKAA